MSKANPTQTKKKSSRTRATKASGASKKTVAKMKNPTKVNPVKKKKMNPAAIVGIVAGIVILTGIIFCIWFFAFYNTPQKIASDAAMNLVSSRQMHITGQQTISEQNTTGKPQVSSYKIDSAMRYYGDTLAYSTDLTLTVANKDNAKDNVNFDVIVDQNNSRYVNFNGLSYIIADNLDQSQSEKTRQAAKITMDILKVLEGEWWQVDANGNNAVTKLLQQQQALLSGNFGCLNDILNAETLDVLNKAYQKYPFLSAIRQGDSDSYLITIDQGQFAEYLNEFMGSDSAKNFRVCLTGDSNATTSNQVIDIFKDQLVKATAYLPKVYAKIGLFDHRVYEITMNDVANFKYEISYPSSMEIKAPDNYRPISDVASQILQPGNLIDITEDVLGL